MGFDLLVKGPEDLSFIVDPSQVNDNYWHLACLNISGKVATIYNLLQTNKACYIRLQHEIHFWLAIIELSMLLIWQEVKEKKGY